MRLEEEKKNRLRSSELASQHVKFGVPIKHPRNDVGIQGDTYKDVVWLKHLPLLISLFLN